METYKRVNQVLDNDYKNLHEQLAQTIIDFFKEKGFPKGAWAVSFTFDDLESSVKAGQWSPYSDSSLEINDIDGNCIFFEM